MEFLPEEIESYSLAHTSSEPKYLYDLYRETHQTVMMPRMLSGHLQGRVLSLLSKMIQPDLIVEIGTYTGYSALCLAEGLSPKGKLITIDVEEELQDIQKKYFEASPFAGQIEAVLAAAMDHIDSLPNNIDLVFIDADKENYTNYYESIIPKLRKGGIIIADNVLWSGKVVQTSDKMDAETSALVEFSTRVQGDERVENVLLPVRDGLMIVRKIE